MEIYIFSKNGIFLSSYLIPFYYSDIFFSVVAYGHSGYEYYFALMNIETDDSEIQFQKYVFNSLQNEISLDKTI